MTIDDLRKAERAVYANYEQLVHTPAADAAHRAWVKARTRLNRAPGK